MNRSDADAPFFRIVHPFDLDSEPFPSAPDEPGSSLQRPGKVGRPTKEEVLARRRRILPRRVNGRQFSPDTRLSEFFEHYVVPSYLEARGSAAENTRQYRQTVGLWCAATGDPAFGDIDDATVNTFLAAIRARRGRKRDRVSPNTVVKHRVTLQKCLDLAGPRCRANRSGFSRVGLFGLDEFGGPREAPFIPRPRAQLDLPSGGWTLKEIAQWMEGCDVCFDNAPEASAQFAFHGVHPADFFIGLILFLYNTCLRKGSALAATRAMIDNGFLEIPPDKMKGGRRGHAVYLNKRAYVAMQLMGTKDDRIVPFPFKDGTLHRYVRRTLAASQIPPERQASIDKPLHALRARCMTEIARTNVGVAKLVAGHTQHDVALGHYVGRDAMKDALKHLRQPKLPMRFRTPKDALAQKTLCFDDTDNAAG